METTVSFRFRGNTHKATLYFDCGECPSFIFVDLEDAGLTQEFGLNVNIKTDYEQRLPRRRDCPDMVALETAIFEAARGDYIFQLEKEKRKQNTS